MDFCTDPINWDDPNFGGKVHVASYIDAEPMETEQ